MAREKYELSQIIGNLTSPHMWVHWVDENGEQHHTPKSLAAIIPKTAKIIKDQT
jgi:hypothetical protein